MPPAVTPADEVKARMLRERQRELGETPSGKQTVLPEEEGTFERNVLLYNRLPPEEKGALRQRAAERIRDETVQAYDQSGLNLNEDQREVFALRFRQERRRLEREIQEKANKERERRVPQIIDQLKREFGRLNSPPAPPKNSPPSESASPSPAR